MKKALIILGLIALAGVATAVFIGYRMYNKPHRNIADETPAFTLTESELVVMFTDNAAGSDQKLKDKVVQLSGSVKKTEESGGIMNLTFDEGGSYIVSVALDSTETDRPQAGAEVSLKGLYVGFIEGDADFGIPGEVKIKNGFVP